MAYGFNDDKSKAEIGVITLKNDSLVSLPANGTATISFVNSNYDYNKALGIKRINFPTNYDIALVKYVMLTNSIDVTVRNLSESVASLYANTATLTVSTF